MSLKRTTRGFVRNLGKLANGTQPKFYLGHDKQAAEDRLEAIETLYGDFCSRTGQDVWDEKLLEDAKAVAAGGPLVVRSQSEPPQWRMTFKGKAKSYPDNHYEPEDRLAIRFGNWSGTLKVPVVVEDGYQTYLDRGLDLLAGKVKQSQLDLSQAKNLQHVGYVGQNLHDAIEAYSEYIRRDCLEPIAGTLTDNGKTKIDNLKTIIAYLPNCDLGQLKEYEKTDELFAVFRRRPVSKRYGKPMSRKSCSNYLGELGRFFRWLHLSKDWNWRKPEDFDAISRRPRELDSDVEREAKDVETWTIDELKILNEYALPIERVFLLLGLNCSYGADQAGRLRISHLYLADEEGKRSFIERIRRKKKTPSKHLLWRQTEQALRWALERRHKQNHPEDFLLLTDNLQPYWDMTESGNRKQAIPNMWQRLLNRVTKDHNIRRLPFNSLRDTSANFIREIAGGETASLHLAHKHQVTDDNLRRYTNPVRTKHYEALRKLERMLQPVFDAAGPEPFSTQRKNYIGLEKIKQIKQLHGNGIGPSDIAKTLGISTTTVYRYLPKKEVVSQPEPTTTDSAVT